MNKIALITDIHFGAREGSTIILEHQRKFYENTFFPYIESSGIDTIVMLGDTFDKRKYTNNYVIEQCKKMFFDVLQKRNITTYIIVGNHDAYFKNTLVPNTVELLLGEYTNLIRIAEPSTVNIKGVDICMIPWICQDNQVACIQEMNNTKADINMGHYEISGFQMYRGVESHGGLSQSTFSKFDMTFSGHYHHRSTNGNITYLGTPYEITWHDYADPKGFHVLDLATRQLEFVQNPNVLFAKISYDDKGVEPVNLDALDLNGTYLKLIVVNKTDFYKFDLFVNKLYRKGCIEIKIIEDIGDFTAGEVSEEVSLEDTQSVLNHYIESVPTDIDKSKIKSYIGSLFTEAINLEVA